MARDTDLAIPCYDIDGLVAKSSEVAMYSMNRHVSAHRDPAASFLE